jgi:hypothetical protein
MLVPAWLDLVGRPTRAAERDDPAHRKPLLRTQHFHLCGTGPVRVAIEHGRLQALAVGWTVVH